MVFPSPTRKRFLRIFAHPPQTTIINCRTRDEPGMRTYGRLLTIQGRPLWVYVKGGYFERLIQIVQLLPV